MTDQEGAQTGFGRVRNAAPGGTDAEERNGQIAYLPLRRTCGPDPDVVVPARYRGAVSTWFERNTHRADEWTVDELLLAKGRTTVSLVVPARNEASTVGGIVGRLRSALMESAALVDEIVVIDSDSTDGTAEVAAAAGARVYASSAIRPDLGTFPGKGEAMWKSLFVATGELIVFMDADLVEWDTHFVPGLLGPLLTRSDIDLVKGYYLRPGANGLDGGRVTELVARPWIALACPDLAGLIQPLAGEWAVRRSLFESLHVPTGYAVELAALVDTAAGRGVDAIAQVDLGRRGHRHQELLDLGLMATQILAAMLRRLPGVDTVAGASGSAVMLEQHQPAGAALRTQTRSVSLVERAPAREVS